MYVCGQNCFDFFLMVWSSHSKTATKLWKNMNKNDKLKAEIEIAINYGGLVFLLWNLWQFNFVNIILVLFCALLYLRYGNFIMERPQGSASSQFGFQQVVVKYKRLLIKKINILQAFCNWQFIKRNLKVNCGFSESLIFQQNCDSRIRK